jgi:hypothetical protein
MEAEKEVNKQDDEHGSSGMEEANDVVQPSAVTVLSQTNDRENNNNNNNKKDINEESGPDSKKEINERESGPYTSDNLSTLCHESIWFCACRCIYNIPATWPRCFYFIVGVIIPLWILIFLSLFLGKFLARFEFPVEIEDNNAILASRASFIFYEQEDYLFLVTALPKSCYQEYLKDNNGTDLVEGEEMEAGILLEYIQECSERYVEPMLEERRERLLNSTTDGVFASSLSFNWIRCWNESDEELGTSVIVPLPSQAQIDASRPLAQASFYTASWKEQQQELFEKYLEKDGNTMEAFEKSIAEATGGECIIRGFLFSPIAVGLLLLDSFTSHRKKLCLCQVTTVLRIR